MIVFWLVAIAALCAALGVGVRLVLSVPTRALPAGETAALPTNLPASDAARDQLGALVPSGDAIVGAPPSVPVAPLLDGVKPGVALSIDLNLVGVEDDRDQVDRELWLLAKQTLSKGEIKR